MIKEMNIQKLDKIIVEKRSIFLFKINQKVRSVEISEDIIQDSYIKAHSAILRGKFVDGSNMGGWFMMICSNASIDYLRNKRKIPSTPVTTNLFTSEGLENNLVEIIGTERTHEDDIIKREVNYNIKSLINHLSKEQKSVLMRRMFYKMSFIEIAKQDGVSINTSLGRMRCALISLRKLNERSKEVKLPVKKLKTKKIILKKKNNKTNKFKKLPKEELDYWHKFTRNYIDTVLRKSA